MKILFLILASSIAIAASASDKGYSRKTLSNGLEVVVIENHLTPLATVEICTRNGSFTEPPEYNGLSHLYEHMFFKSNAVYPSQEKYMERVHELGIIFNGTTHQEFVNYFFTLPKVNFTAGMQFMADAIMTPKFDQTELEKEREVVLGEFDRNEAGPIFPLIRAMDSAVWLKYPSRKQPLGERPTIKTATTEKMRTIQNKFYIPNNSMLIVGGDVTPDEVFAEAEKVLGAWKRGDDPFAKESIPEQEPIKHSEIIKVAAQIPFAFVDQTWLGPSVGKDDKSTFSADVFSFILSQPTSKFQKALVESGLAIGIDLSYFTQKYVGPIGIQGRILPDKLAEALKATKSEIQKWDSDDYFTDEELAAAKHILKINHLYEVEKTSEYLHTVSFFWASGGFGYMDDYLDNVEKVSRADIKRYVDTYIKGKPSILGIAMSDEAIKSVQLNPAEVLQ